MVVSNYGVLATSFTPGSCNTYYLLAPFFKGLCNLVSQHILSHAGLSSSNHDITSHSWSQVSALHSTFALFDNLSTEHSTLLEDNEVLALFSL